MDHLLRCKGRIVSVHKELSRCVSQMEGRLKDESVWTFHRRSVYHIANDTPLIHSSTVLTYRPIRVPLNFYTLTFSWLGFLLTTCLSLPGFQIPTLIHSFLLPMLIRVSKIPLRINVIPHQLLQHLRFCHITSKPSVLLYP